jgi:hypothetical protein
MRSPARSSIVLALTLVLCACQVEAGGGSGNSAVPAPERDGKAPPANDEHGEPAGGVELSASPKETKTKSSVTLTLRNGSAHDVGYNLCTSALETAAGREVPTSRVCTMELRTLEPGSTTTSSYQLPVNMLEGSYRFATQVHSMESGSVATVRSNAFTVRAP